MNKNSRTFWVYDRKQSEWTVITVRPDQTKTLQGGGRTEEGYHYWAEEYCWEDDGIRLTVASDSQDCDGRMSHFQELFCKTEDLQSKDHFYCDVKSSFKIPKWEKLEESQRDYSAEAMGY